MYGVTKVYIKLGDTPPSMRAYPVFGVRHQINVSTVSQYSVTIHSRTSESINMNFKMASVL